MATAAIPPGALIPWIEQRFLKLVALPGVAAVLAPNAAGTVHCFASNGTTPKPTFSHWDLIPGTENPVIIQLDDDGRPPSNIYMDRGGYTFVVKDQQANTLYTVSCEDTAGSFAAALGLNQSQGSKDVNNGYQALPTDHYITTNPNEVTDPSVLVLPDRTTWQGAFLIIKNKSAVTWQLTPFGTQTIDGINAAILLGPAAGGTQPTIMFLPVEGGWDVISGASTGSGALPPFLAYLNVAQTWTAAQTFPNIAITSPTFTVGGHSVTVTADCVIPSAGGGGTPLPPNLAFLDVPQTWTAAQTFGYVISTGGIDISGDLTASNAVISGVLTVLDHMSSVRYDSAGETGITNEQHIQMRTGPDQRLRFRGGICTFWGA